MEKPIVGEAYSFDKDSIPLELYFVQGVREYWIVARIAQRVEVYRRENNQLTLMETLLTTDSLQSP